MIIDREKLTLEKIFAYASLENRKILEIGCGDGRITEGLFVKSGSLVAIDPDPKSISIAKERIPDADFRVGSGEDLGFLNDAFDVVLFTLSLHHQNARKALKETAAVLKDDGQVLIIEPAVDSEVSIICNVFNDETAVLNNAVKDINASIFNVVCSEKFHAEWEFENNEELYSWLFDFYQTPFDHLKVAQVNQRLGNNKQSKPVILRDKLVITILRKTSPV